MAENGSNRYGSKHMWHGIVYYYEKKVRLQSS